MSLLTALLAVLALALAFLAWVWLARILTRPGPDPCRRLTARCADGWALAVYHRAAPTRRFVEPVVLCHGLAANRYNFDLDPPYSLSAYLAEAGFECFVVEWRGTGGSRRPPPGRRAMSPSFDEHVDQDGPAAVALALQESAAPRAFWVGHSLGGLAGYGFAQGPGGALLAGLVTMGSPVALQAGPFVRRMTRFGLALSLPWVLRHEHLCAAIAPLAGRLHVSVADFLANTREIEPHVLRQLLAHQIASIGRPMLLQLADWVETGSFRSLDHTRDYRAGLAKITTPVLCLAGAADRVAPPEAVLPALERLGSTDKSGIVLGPDGGHAAAYGHADLTFGRCAPAEVYPIVAAWLEARAARIIPAP